MAGLDNLSRGELPGILKRLRALETATPLQNASIGSGGLRVHSGGVITIENGGLRVTGTAEIIGALIASGTIDFTGDVTVSGPMGVSGVMTVANDLIVASGGQITAGTIELNPDGSAKFGSMTISPAGKITSGSAEINPDGSAKFGNLTIDTAGKVTAGGVTLDPSYLSGSLKFSNGTYVAATPNGAQLVKPSGGAVTVSSGQADVGIPGGGSVIASTTAVTLIFGARQLAISSTGTAVTGHLSVSGISTLSGPMINSGMTETTNAANCWVSGGFQFYKVTSASRFKVDPQPMDLPDSLLDVTVKDWWDKGEVERGEQGRRVPGVIAEEVEAAGGEAFVTYDEDGTIQGVAYDRYALARTEVLARKLDAALARIAELENAA